MKAKKCDRCGQFFVDYEEFEGYIKLTVASNTPSRYQVKQDLCQECEKSLIEWFKMGESDVRKNDNEKSSGNKNEQSDTKKK